MLAAQAREPYLGGMRLPVILCVALAATACRSDNEPVKLSPGQASAPAASAPASTARPSPHPPTAPPAVSPGATAGGALQYSVPTGWIVQTPTSAMRKAQFLLPKEPGDAEDAQLVLFYFGGEGGSKADNLKRWGDYFAPADGSAAPPLETTTRTVNDMPVTEVSAAGTLDTSKVQGMGSGMRENWRMLAAIIESPSGPYFARLLGPGATVTRWEPSFRQWISSLKPQP